MNVLAELAGEGFDEMPDQQRQILSSFRQAGNGTRKAQAKTPNVASFLWGGRPRSRNGFLPRDPTSATSGTRNTRVRQADPVWGPDAGVGTRPTNCPIRRRFKWYWAKTPA